MKVQGIESGFSATEYSSAHDREPIVNYEENFEVVYREYVEFVWRVLRGMGISDSLVEDAVQDVFLVVQRRLNDFDYKHSIKTWLFEISYRVACTYRRRIKRKKQYQPLSDHITDQSPSPADNVEQRQGLRFLEEVLDELDDDKRAILILAEIEEMSAPEIAEITGSKLNTVYSRLRRARSQFNQVLASRYRRTP